MSTSRHSSGYPSDKVISVSTTHTVTSKCRSLTSAHILPNHKVGYIVLKVCQMNPVYILYFLKIHFHIFSQSATQTYYL
jgi:hypothetical protein